MGNRKHDIERYLRGELSPSEMHALEKAALSDPFLAEALEGVEQTGADDFLFDLHKLNKSVRFRTRGKKRKNKTIKMWGWTVGIAASVLLIAVAGFLVVNLVNDQRQNLSMAEEQEAVPAPKNNTSPDTLAGPLEENEAAEVADAKSGTRSDADDTPTIRPGIANRKPAERETAPESDLNKDQPSDVKQDAKRYGYAASEIQTESADAVDSVRVEALAREQALNESKSETHQDPVASGEKISAAPAFRGADTEGGDADKKLKAKSELSRTGATARSITKDLKLLKGNVISADDGSALPGVNVVIKGTNIGTVTDVQGNFHLSLPADQTEIVFSFIGFESTEVAVGDKEEVDVKLESDVSQLSEVVVTGYSSDDFATEEVPFRFAEPEGGRGAFKTYLSKSLKYPAEAVTNGAEGKVTVRFTVEPDGKLTNFEVIKGIGYGCEEELIKLIQKGPTWKPSTKNNQPLRDQVRVRYKFELPKKQ
jgi:TonB family protein